MGISDRYKRRNEEEIIIASPAEKYAHLIE